MMQHEFEELAGYRVKHEDYRDIIEPMYMAVGLSKAEFVKCLDRSRFALPTRGDVYREMAGLAAGLMRTSAMDERHILMDRMDQLKKELGDRYAGRFVFELTCNPSGYSVPHAIVWYTETNWTVIERRRLIAF